jgi:hypothetical protein
MSELQKRARAALFEAHEILMREDPSEYAVARAMALIAWSAEARLTQETYKSPPDDEL